MNVSFPRRHILGIGAAFASVATFGDKSAMAAPIDPLKTVKWDKSAEKEVLELLHHMHHAWNEGDLGFIRKSVAEDGFIGTFELTGDEEAAVLNSRDDLVIFVERLFKEQIKSGARTEASPNRSHQVLATETFAICTEQCDLIERHSDGTKHVLPHRATSVLAKSADGWKFVHWHVSQGGPGKIYDAAGKNIT
jgi:hypothetical protein